jgi:outer membrane protein TolC
VFNMKTYLFLGACLLAAGSAGAQVAPASTLPQASSTGLTLQQAIEHAQRNGLQARAALGVRDAARGRDRAFDARMLPQISLGGNLPNYQRSIVGVIQPDGSTIYRPLQETRADLNMLVSQQIPFTGGTLLMSSRLNNRKGNSVPETWQSSPFSVTLQQPILRANAIGWNNEVNGLQADIAERQYFEERENIALAVATAFFDYYAAQVSLRNQTTNAATNDTLYRLNQGRFEVGKISENDLLQSELALLRARTAADGARLERDRAEAALRLALNLPASAPLEIVVTSDVPEINADTAMAVQQALRNLSTIRSIDLQETTAKRGVSEARFNGGPGATINATYGYNATGSTRTEVYRDLQQAQQFALSVQMPILTWGARGADVQAARAELTRAQSTGAVMRETARQEAHFAALQVSLARRQLAISAKADTVAQKRFEVSYNRYVIGRIDVDQLYLAQNEKDQALLQYVQALRGYWQAHYRLRRVTLYDFERGVGIR